MSRPRPWCRRVTRPSSSPTRAWCSSRGFSSARSAATTSGPRPARSAYGPAASTTISRTWGGRRATTPSSRCSATFPSATTSRPTPSPSPGNSSPRISASTAHASRPPCSPTTTTPSTSGGEWPGSPTSASCASVRRTTSGPWGIPGPAVPAPKSTSTRATTCPAQRWRPGDRAWGRPAIAIGGSRSGTWSSCSSTATPAGP